MIAAEHHPLLARFATAKRRRSFGADSRQIKGSMSGGVHASEVPVRFFEEQGHVRPRHRWRKQRHNGQ